jgi:hypothetical protein
MARRSCFLTLGLPLFLTACSGMIGGDGDTGPVDGGPQSTPHQFVCDPAVLPAASPLRRLSHRQYQNTITDLIRFAAPDAADAALVAVAPLWAQLPDDVRTGPDKHYAGFSRLDQTLQQEHVDGAYQVANTVGMELTATSERLEDLAGVCATDVDPANDDACLDGMIRRLGERALRRPVTDDDVAFYRGPAGGPPFESADYADVVALLLNAPHLLYFVEHGQEGDSSAVPLDAYELASRLSYHFWQTLPDDQLFEAAANGSLLTEEGYAAEVDRIFAQPRTREAVAEFFGQWLENTTLEELDSRAGTPVFDAFAGDFEPGPDLREHMLAEVTDAALYYTFESSGDFSELLTSDRSFAKTADLASIYGVDVWSGGDPPAFVEPQRVGLITKGVFLRKALLCDDIPPPPPNAAANPPMLSDSLSTRQVVEELTGQGACAGCHVNTINPLGFATENFDALGRFRTEQPLYDPDTGQVVGTASVDTTVTPRVDKSNDTIAGGPSDLTELIANSPKPYACFARHYFRFTFGRMEEIDRDGCALANLQKLLDDRKPIAEVLRAIAMSNAFRLRSFELSVNEP